MNARGYFAMLLTVLSVSVLLIDGSAYGEQDNGWTAGYLERGVSMRARGLNGAFVGVVDDATSTVYNPAGLVYLDGAQVLGTIERLNFSTMLSFISAALPQGRRLDSNLTRAFSFGAGWMHLHSGEFERRGENDNALGNFSIDEGTMFFSAAAAIRPDSVSRWRLSAGITQKVLYQTVEKMRWGSGLDLGVQVHLMRDTTDTSEKLATFGASFVNLIQPKIGTGEETYDRVPRSFKMGASTVFLLPQRLKLDSVNALVSCELDMTWRDPSDTKFLMGIELSRKFAGQSSLALRTGFGLSGEDDSWSFGIGIRIPFTSSRVDADLMLADNVGADRALTVRSDVVRTSLGYTWLTPEAVWDTVVVDTGTTGPESGVGDTIEPIDWEDPELESVTYDPETDTTKTQTTNESDKNMRD